ncbi:hypothetical protein Tco_1318368 [Tanacetum coccineum]
MVLSLCPSVCGWYSMSRDHLLQVQNSGADRFFSEVISVPDKCIRILRSALSSIRCQLIHVQHQVVQQQLNNACLSRWWSWSMLLNRHPYCTGFDLKRQDEYWVERGSVDAAYQSQMPLYSQLEGTVEGSAGARCSSSSSSSSSFSTSSSSLSSLDDSLS